jgi:microcystin-dependent protein
MSQPYVGQITMFGGNFAPRGYMFCNGQLVPIAQYQALFSLIGTNYGGNGTTNFALPNLQSCLSNHMGQGPGLANYDIGQTAGTETVTITTATMPQHSHLLLATTGPATTGTVGNTVVPATAAGSKPPDFYAANISGQPVLQMVALNPTSCGPAGQSQPHDNLMPSLCITFIIAVTGIFPSRN